METVTNFLNKIRAPGRDVAFKRKAINTALVFVLGIALGIFSKWLDNLSINDSIWWQHILGILDLRNVFSDFGIWIFAAITPILAFICWYAKGKGTISLIISSIILAVMFLSSFSIAIWYFALKSIIDLIIFGATILMLYQSPKSSITSLIIALLLAYGARIVGV